MASFFCKMGVDMKYYRLAHVVYHTQYHLVWIPRFRRKFLVPGVKEYLIKKLDEVRKYYPEIYFVERNIQTDHVHILLGIPPKYSVSKVVNILKSNTSRALRKRFTFLSRLYANQGSIWSVGYFISTVGINESIVRKYIRFQKKEDSGQQLHLGLS